MQRRLGSCPEGALLWRSVSLGISEVGSVGGEQSFIYMEISQGLGIRLEVTGCSLFTANQVLECLWSAKWGHGGREWQSHSLKMLLRPGGGLQTKPGNVKGNGSLKFILCNPFIFALTSKQLWGQQRPGLVTASEAEGFRLERQGARQMRKAQACDHALSIDSHREWNKPTLRE